MSENHAEGQPSEESLVAAFKAGDESSWMRMPKELQEKLLRPESTAMPRAGATENVDENAAEPVAGTGDVKKLDGESQRADAKRRDKHQKKTPEQLRELALERANLVNQQKQQHEAYLRKLKTDPKFRAQQAKEQGWTPGGDVWSDDHQNSLAKEVLELKTKLAARETADVARESESALRKVCEDMEQQAETLIGHKFEAPVSEIDQAVKRFADMHEGREPTVEELGKLGFDLDDAETFVHMVNAQKLMHSEGFRSYRAAWNAYAEDNDLSPASPASVPGVPTSPEDKDRQARRDRMDSVLGKPKLMESQRAAVAEQGLTKEYALRWLEAHKDPEMYSPKDLETYNRIMRMQGF